MSAAPNGDSLSLEPLDNTRQPMRPQTWAWLLALLGWTTVVAFYDLGGGARFEPIDCWVAQTAREMLDANDWLVPRFSGETRMQKSPGPYWAVMAVSLLRAAPVDEFSARVPNALAAIILVGTIFWLTRRIAGDRAAGFAGFASSASVLILWWSHRGASDLGLTTCTTVTLAALWVAAECEPPGRKRGALFLLAYFAAGVGMLWKMPMPLVVVGLPAFCYVVLRNRWRVLASPIHLLGLVVFLLPWLPWAIAVMATEETALLKWKVEFVDRYTGALPNVEGQDSWKFLFTYLGPPLLYCLPFSLSLPAAIGRAFRRQEGVKRDGTLFMLIWFVSLLVFFTTSTGKEWRYFLPALPPLFVLLGIELAALFNPQRRQTPKRDRLAAIGVWIGVPAALIGGGVGLHYWWLKRGQFELEKLYEWSDVLTAYVIVAIILAGGIGAAAWCYLRRREHGAFALLVVTMWVMWLWAWPKLMPLVMSQRPFVDFAQQLERCLLPGDEELLRQVGSQDSRIIWYSDCRFPRVIDQLALLREQEGKRTLDFEVRRVGEEVIEGLDGERPALYVATLQDYVQLLIQAPGELATVGRAMPPVHLWLQTRYGTLDRHYVLFGNEPPPRFAEPELRVPDKLRARIAGAATQPTATTQPATQPTPEE